MIANIVTKRQQALDEHRQSAQLPRIFGAMHSGLIQQQEAISRVRAHVLAHTDANAHAFHGPSHWARVETHAKAISASLGVSPVVPVVFALVHDSQRLSDGHDPWHGQRAAKFVREHRAGLFAFLSDADSELLQEACAKHSDGLVSEDPVIQACWDADRLDLWRVGTRPDPKFMGSAFAKRPAVIRHAQALATLPCMSTTP